MMTNKKVNAVFLIGLPDSKELVVHGYNLEGKLLYMWDGNGDFHAQIVDPNIEVRKINIVWFENNGYQIAKPDIIVNCINDADICLKSLQKAQEFIDSVKEKLPQVKIFNDPKAVMHTTRDAIYQNYHNLAGIHIPKTIKIKPQSPAQVIEEVKKNGMNFPFLIRPCGAHQSQGLQLIENQSQMLKLEVYPYGSQEYYVTEYVDYKFDGFYKKARLVIIDGKIIARHFMTGESWMVHGNLHEEYMAARESCKEGEMYFLHNYKKMISREALQSLRIIYEKSQLDYLGFDFAIMPDKSLLIFEINPAQNVFLKLNKDHFPYMQKVSEDMVKALNKAIYRKALMAQEI